MAERITRQERRERTAARILDAARVEFGELGLERATVRAIAARAGVDPSLVIQHYGSKAALFAEAIRLRATDEGDDVADHLRRVLDVRLDEPPPQTLALLRSMLTAPEATEVMRVFLDERATSLADRIDDPDAELRAALAVSSIMGLTVARHLLGLAGLQEISERQLEDVVRPWLAATLQPGGADEERRR